MITVISRHYCTPQNLDTSIRLLHDAAEIQSTFKGYISRQTLQSHASHLEVITLTSWESKEAQQVWFHSQERQKVSEPTTTGSFWEKPPEHELLEILD